MKCKHCGADNAPLKKCCDNCGKYLEGYTVNNVTGEHGYRGSDGEFYRSEEEYLNSMRLRDKLEVSELDFGNIQTNSLYINEKSGHMVLSIHKHSWWRDFYMKWRYGLTAYRKLYKGGNQ